MKIVQIDNVCNGAFQYVKFLRKTGVECDLLVEKDSGSDPLISTGEKYNWVKYWKRTNPISKLFILRDLTRDYDLIHANGGAVVYALFLGKPFILHSMGSDLRLVAQFKSPPKGKILELVKNTITGILFRIAIKKCDKFFCAQPDQLPLIEKMGIKNVTFVFQLVDTYKFMPRKTKRKTKPVGLLVLFSPTRHSWKTKGNDKFFRAFARFLKKHPDALLVSVYWDIHKEKSKALVKQLGIQKNVKFISFLNESQMIDWYHKSDVLVDEFNIGSFGMNSLEAMSCGKPVMRYIDEKLHSIFYRTKEKPPIENAHSEEEIFNGLVRLANKKHREKLGKKAREFILTYHNWKRTTNILIKEYNQVLETHGCC